MARVFTEGFGSGDMLFFTSFSSSNDVVTTNPRPSSDIYSVLLAGAASNCTKAFSALSEGFFRIAGRFPANVFFRWFSGSTQLGEARINASTRLLELYTSTGTLVATGDLPVLANTWYCVEIRVKIADSGGVLSSKIDGHDDATFTGDTKPGAATTFNSVAYWTAGLQIDDLAMNDTSGGFDDSWCGDGHVFGSPPTGDGGVTQLTPSSGTVHYSLLDEVPNDGDTSYVQGSVVDERDLLTFAASGLVNVGILRVWGRVVAKDTVAAGGLLAVVVKTNGVEYTGADRSLLTSYHPALGDDLRLNPNTGAAWTVSELDAVQMGPKTRS